MFSRWSTSSVLRSTRRLGVFCSVARLAMILLVSIMISRSALNGGAGRGMSKTTEEKMNTRVPAPFYDVLRKALKKRKTSIENICPISDSVARRVLEDYGAMFLANRKVMPPPVCVFANEREVTRFQEEAGYVTETIADAEIELQLEAMKALLKAREEAQKEGLDITPRDGAEAARRNYDDSFRLWNTRFLPALDYWLTQGRLTAEQVERLKS